VTWLLAWTDVTEGEEEDSYHIFEKSQKKELVKQIKSLVNHGCRWYLAELFISSETIIVEAVAEAVERLLKE